MKRCKRCNQSIYIGKTCSRGDCPYTNSAGYSTVTTDSFLNVSDYSTDNSSTIVGGGGSFGGGGASGSWDSSSSSSDSGSSSSDSGGGGGGC